MNVLAKTTKNSSAFTFIELTLVITILAVLTMFVAVKTGSYNYWKQQSTIRELSGLLNFLHNQAISDQSYYKMEFDIDRNAYRVGILKADSDISAIDTENEYSDVGNLTREINDFMNPTLGDAQTLIPPPSYPSLFEPTFLPDGMKFDRIKTEREDWDKNENNVAEIIFSPKGYSEFSDIYLKFETGQVIVLAMNPYTGIVDILNKGKNES